MLSVKLSPEKTIDYAVAKTAYFRALPAEMPELMKIATGKEERPPEVDTFAAAFAVAGEKQEMAADQGTLVLLKRFSGIPTLKRRSWNSTVLKKSRRDSLKTSMDSTSPETLSHLRHVGRHVQWEASGIFGITSPLACASKTKYI